jgi:hypothetical protein
LRGGWYGGGSDVLTSTLIMSKVPLASSRSAAAIHSRATICHARRLESVFASPALIFAVRAFL